MADIALDTVLARCEALDPGESWEDETPLHATARLIRTIFRLSDDRAQRRAAIADVRLLVDSFSGATSYAADEVERVIFGQEDARAG